MTKLREDLTAGEVIILDMNTEFPRHIAEQARRCRHYILDTNLSREVVWTSGASVQKEYERVRDERISKGEVELLN